jgi:hypothetical protein
MENIYINIRKFMSMGFELHSVGVLVFLVLKNSKIGLEIKFHTNREAQQRENLFKRSLPMPVILHSVAADDFFFSFVAFSLLLDSSKCVQSSENYS